MAIVNGYARLPDLKAALQIDDDNLDRRLERVIEAASRAIDKVCRRKFYRETLTLYFSGGQRTRIDPFSERRLAGVHSLAVGDLISVTTLKTDDDGDRTFETTWDASRDYYLAPVNAPTVPKPYSHIEADGINGRYWFPPHIKGVELVGEFGWAFDYAGTGEYVEPPDVSEACLLLSTRYLKRKDAPLGVLETSGLDLVREEIRVHSDPDVKALLKPYRRLHRP